MIKPVVPWGTLFSPKPVYRLWMIIVGLVVHGWYVFIGVGYSHIDIIPVLGRLWHPLQSQRPLRLLVHHLIWVPGHWVLSMYVYIQYIYTVYIYICISKSKYLPIWVLAAGWVVDIGSHIVLKSHMLGNTAPQYIRVNWNDRACKGNYPKTIEHFRLLTYY